MLLGLLVYGCAAGVRSSRRVERACTGDVAFRVACAQDAPDHAAIARFRREHFADLQAMEDLFGQVLGLAARAGLGRLGLIALDGTKIAASASKDANRAAKRLRELAARILAGAAAVDAAEDELYGDGRGDELPAELAGPKTRAERIRPDQAAARQPRPWPPGRLPRKGSPPTGTAARSPKHPSATPSTTPASAASPCAACSAPAANGHSRTPSTTC
jgi:hypothetical protein